MNFCTEGIGTKIEVVDRVSEEGYEVSNLLRDGSSVHCSTSGFMPMTRNPGFMAALFIRPPITIRLDFPIPIHISHIVLAPKLGQQISSGFKLQTCINSSQGIPLLIDKNELHQIGREFLRGPLFPDTVVFRNPRFVLGRRFRSLPLSEFESCRNFPNAFELKHPSFNSCERVFSLCVTIERAESPARIPVLASLQVWGQPSQWSDPSLCLKVVKIWLENHGNESQVSRENVADSQLLDNDEECNEPPHKLPKVSERDIPFSIPEEFLDPITFEIICQPLRLPCGLAVDASTLEKYLKEGSKWGRMDNDPFTGKCFTENSRPLPDFSLKSRIDAFLLANAGKVNSPRTLGTKLPNYHNTMQPHSSRLTSDLPAPLSAVEPRPHDTERDDGIHLTGQEFMNRELNRILVSGKSMTSSMNASRNQILKAPLNRCFKCFLPSSDRDKQTNSKEFYRTPCKDVLVCRSCVVLIDKTKVFKCNSCNLQWSVKELSRTFFY